MCDEKDLRFTAWQIVGTWQRLVPFCSPACKPMSPSKKDDGLASSYPKEAAF